MFKTLTDQTVTVELKNDLCITGVLKSVDQCVAFLSHLLHLCPVFVSKHHVQLVISLIRMLSSDFLTYDWIL